MLKCLFCFFLNLSLLFAADEIPGTVAEIYKHASDYDLLFHRIDPPNHQVDQPKPAIVFFFGGGWVGGTPTQFLSQGEYLAKRGLVVFLADYRVKKRQNTTPKECVLDGSSAIRFVRQHAKRFGVDPNRIAAGGGSAGGHVAASTGICEGFDEPGENLKISSRSNALVLFNPVYDNSPEGYGHDRAKDWFPAISPMHNITEDDPSTIVFLGEKDNLIPVKTAEEFQYRQKRLGIHSELYTYKEQPHGFFNLSKGGPEIYKDTVLKTDAFLVKLGYLSGEADLAYLDEIIKKYSPQKK